MTGSQRYDEVNVSESNDKWIINYELKKDDWKKNWKKSKLVYDEEVNVYESNDKKRFELATRNHINDVVKMQRRKKKKK